MDGTVSGQTLGRIRRPSNPFFIFSNENRLRVSLENPGIGNREISRLLGSLWAQMDSTDKQQYVKSAANIKQQLFKDNPGYKFTNKRKAIGTKSVAKQMVQKKSKVKSDSNVVILRAIDNDLETTDLSLQTSDEWTETPKPTAPEEFIAEEKLIFTRLLGLCGHNSKEYLDIKTNLALKSLNQQMSHWMLRPILRIRRRKFTKTSVIVPKSQLKSGDKVPKPRGRPRKRVRQVIYKSCDIICNSVGQSNDISKV